MIAFYKVFTRVFSFYRRGYNVIYLIILSKHIYVNLYTSFYIKYANFAPHFVATNFQLFRKWSNIIY
jgi:hypothetical protein